MMSLRGSQFVAGVKASFLNERDHKDAVFFPRSAINKAVRQPFEQARLPMSTMGKDVK